MPVFLEKELAMDHQIEQVKEKILAFHPEIDQNNVGLSVTWDAAAKRFALKLSKAGEAVGAYLEQKDADDCLAGQKCVNLAVQVTQLLAELEDLVTPRKPG
jgi:hypothetical protein